ncbi:MAG: LamG domain-containing protein [bacterium]
MKISMYYVVFLLTVALGGTAWAEKEQKEPQLRLELDLIDGSLVIGVPGIGSVPVETPYAKLRIPLKQIVTIKIGRDRETASLDLQNGDKLKGVINLETIKLKTLFGAVSIGIKYIAALRVTAIPVDVTKETEAACVPTGADLSKGLVAYYPFNGDAGDHSGNQNHGKLVGAAFEDAGSAKALRVNGNASSYVKVQRAESLEPADGITISMWIKGVPGQAAGYGWGTLLRKADNFQPGYFIRGGGVSGFNLDQNPTRERLLNIVAVGFLPFTEKRWQHIAATYSRAAGLAKTYQDGALVNQSPLADRLLHSGDLYIGGADVFGDDGGFNGLIRKLRIYNRALPVAEVLALCNKGSN